MPAYVLIDLTKHATVAITTDHAPKLVHKWRDFLFQPAATYEHRSLEELLNLLESLSYEVTLRSFVNDSWRAEVSLAPASQHTGAHTPTLAAVRKTQREAALYLMFDLHRRGSYRATESGRLTGRNSVLG